MWCIIASFFRSYFFITGAGNVFVTFCVEYPAVCYEKFNSFCGVIRIGIDFVCEEFFRLFGHPHCKAVRTMYYRTEALAESVSKFVSVEEVCDCMTYCLELSRTKVALELDFAVTVTFEGNGFVTTLCYHVECGVNFGTVGERVKNVDCAGCKSIELSCGIGFNDNELLDLGFNAFEVTSIVGVDFKN